LTIIGEIKMNHLIALAASAAYLSSDLVFGDGEEEEEEEESSEGSLEVEKPAKSKKSKKVKKMKKGAKRAEKSSKKESKADKNVVRLKDLAKQAKIGEASARKKLRDADVERGEGRWSWDLGSKALKSARKALGLAN
jgi:hypothetical protein